MMLASALQPDLLNNSYHEFKDNFLQAFGSGQHRGGSQWVFRKTDSLANRLGTADHFDGQALAAQIADDAVSSLRKADCFNDDAISCKDLRVMLEYAITKKKEHEYKQRRKGTGGGRPITPPKFSKEEELIRSLMINDLAMSDMKEEFGMEYLDVQESAAIAAPQSSTSGPVTSIFHPASTSHFLPLATTSTQVTSASNTFVPPTSTVTFTLPSPSPIFVLSFTSLSTRPLVSESVTASLSLAIHDPTRVSSPSRLNSTSIDSPFSGSPSPPPTSHSSAFPSSSITPPPPSSRRNSARSAKRDLLCLSALRC
ncbi:hypothetical protein GWK47_013732 [Chionoecetes opilio]|uniref:Uncharacterized protein n=1 Tax=Chionoecetes opilio TaxID=41210 RepID=A0A8J4XUE4_CHIOP|nr:hypothetical protein GWK47_013732 [Chionoecetes opilio]